MTDWRSNMRKMRDVVHSTFGVPCVYVAFIGAPPRRLNPEVQTKFVDSNLTSEGLGRGLGNVMDTVPRIVFSRDELAVPRVKGLVFVGASEGYRINNIRPHDDTRITVEVVPLDAKELADLWDQDYAALLVS